MSIKLNLSSVLSYYINNQQSVEVNGNTVGDCLDNLANQYPELKKVIFTQDGKLADFIDVCINEKDAFSYGLSKPVKDGDELSIALPSGGCC